MIVGTGVSSHGTLEAFGSIETIRPSRTCFLEESRGAREVFTRDTITVVISRIRVVVEMLVTLPFTVGEASGLDKMGVGS
jgi:hypothetical protein